MKSLPKPPVTVSLIRLALITLVLAACQSQKFTVANLPDTQLNFGSGGGFTGKSTQYTLLENGQLFSSNSLTNEKKELPKVSKKVAQDLFAAAEKLQLAGRNFDHPGNMSYFVQVRKGEELAKVTWGSASHTTPQDILDFYQRLQNTLIH